MNVSRGNFLMPDEFCQAFRYLIAVTVTKLALRFSLYRYTTKIVEGHCKKLGVILFGATLIFSFVSRLKNVRNLSEKHYVSVRYQVLGTDRIFFNAVFGSLICESEDFASKIL